MERLSTALSATVAEEGSFSGMASVRSSIAMGARGPTRFSRGAFSDTLAKSGGRLPLLWQHDAARPVGVISGLVETDEGLEIHGRITRNSFGNDVLALMRDQAVSGLSIGFEAISVGYEKQSDGSQVRVVTKADLFETSLVTFPADMHARIHTVHSAAMAVELGDTWTTVQREFLYEVLNVVMLDEQHEGRMFSAANLGRMKDAWRALCDLIVKVDSGFLSEAIAALEAKAAEERKQAAPSSETEAYVRKVQHELREAEIDALMLGALERSQEVVAPGNPWRVEKRDGKFVVVKSADGEVVGEHDSEKAAVAHMRALHANVKHQRISLEVVEQICPPCAERMRANGWTHLGTDTLFERLQLDLSPAQIAGLCKRLGAEDPGLHSRCVAMMAGKVDDPAAFCNELHKECTGTYPGEHVDEE